MASNGTAPNASYTRLSHGQVHIWREVAFPIWTRAIDISSNPILQSWSLQRIHGKSVELVKLAKLAELVELVELVKMIKMIKIIRAGQAGQTDQADHADYADYADYADQALSTCRDLGRKRCATGVGRC
jgi:hypothetical protein